MCLSQFASVRVDSATMPCQPLKLSELGQQKDLLAVKNLADIGTTASGSLLAYLTPG